MDLVNELHARGAAFAASLSDPWQQAAFAAALLAGALIIASTLVKTIIPLRWLALGGNVGFVVYGLAHPAPMVFLLHAALLPINLWRVLEMQRLTRHVRAAGTLQADALLASLQPFMRRSRLAAGAELFRAGDFADRLYLLAKGRLQLAENAHVIEAGQLVGEIAFFSREQRRTATVRALEACTLFSIDEATFRQLFFQNPAFGFEVARLIAARLGRDVEQLRREALGRARETA